MKQRRCFYKCGSEKYVVRNGSYRRQSDSRTIQKFKCLSCKRAFSQASASRCFKQKKRRVNYLLGRLISSKMSQKRCALILGVNRHTVAHKQVFLATIAAQKFDRSVDYSKIEQVQFDDLETTEHTKLKPVSVSLAVDAKTRKILAIELSRMPAKGHLAALSNRKYGKREDGRPQALRRLFATLKSKLPKQVTFRSDQNPLYPIALREHFSSSVHETVRSRRACVAGQGELKKIGFDPLFSLNQTCAMLRDNLNRLVRRTWCTTKKIESLKHQLYLYADFHNSVLTKNHP